MVLALEAHALALHDLYLETEPLVERLGVGIVDANCQLDAGEALRMSLAERGFKKLRAEPFVTYLRDKTDSKMTDMRPGFAVSWQDITPTHDLLSLEGDELTAIVRNYAAIESERLFEWWRLHEGKEALLAGHDVQGAVQPREVLLSSWNNGVAHDAHL